VREAIGSQVAGICKEVFQWTDQNMASGAEQLMRETATQQAKMRTDWEDVQRKIFEAQKYMEEVAEKNAGTVFEMEMAMLRKFHIISEN
jgi:hypothetical protein